ncbi:MAG: biotin--[acetyl-CoA-carboxylase] ligase [Elusimicrobia bacterium]|nr:biotin--[acetyl-CoA-carboxylase] ligase [Elusimicrobiota bacterium]
MVELLLKETSLHVPLSLKEFNSLPGGWGEDMGMLAPWEKSCPDFLKSLVNEDSFRTIVVGKTPSLMDLIRAEEIRGEISDWDSLIAFSQEAGRGRLGRSWASLPGNITGAIRLPLPPKGYETLLPLLLSDIIAFFLMGLGLSIRVKWPNDLILNSGKVGGILIEEKAGIFIAGIGINLFAAPELVQKEFTSEAFPPLALLGYLKNPIGPLTFWRKLVKEIQIKYNYAINNLSPHEFVEDFSARMLLLSEKVMLTETWEGEISGVLTGLTEEGALRVLTEGGERIFLNGSLRPA